MKNILFALLLAISITACGQDADPSTDAKAPTASQERMKACNSQAGTQALKGDDRKAFMKDCLSNKSDMTAQQGKMKTCNAAAAGKALKGDERKAFMKDCLSSK